MSYNSVEVAALITSAILSSGALTFFIKYGVKMAVMEKMLDNSQLITLHPRLSLVESAVSEIKNSLADLKHLPKIAAQLEAMAENFSHLAAQVVPRNEHESRWNASDNRISSLEHDIRDLKK
jgi:uncharacterized coiled-coil protein SlyX